MIVAARFGMPDDVPGDEEVGLKVQLGDHVQFFLNTGMPFRIACRIPAGKALPGISLWVA